MEGLATAWLLNLDWPIRHLCTGSTCRRCGLQHGRRRKTWTRRGSSCCLPKNTFRALSRGIHGIMPVMLRVSRPVHRGFGKAVMLRVSRPIHRVSQKAFCERLSDHGRAGHFECPSLLAAKVARDILATPQSRHGRQHLQRLRLCAKVASTLRAKRLTCTQGHCSSGCQQWSRRCWMMALSAFNIRKKVSKKRSLSTCRVVFRGLTTSIF